MENAARVLHATYSTWRDRAARQDRATMRSVVDPLSFTGQIEVHRAVRCLLVIKDTLTNLRTEGRFNTQVYERQYPIWWSGVLGVNTGWNEPIRADSIITSSELNEIESFANFLDGKISIIGNDGLVTLRSLLEKARHALEVDLSLSDELRTYIHRLIRLIQDSLEDEELGIKFDLDSAVQSLYFAFKLADAQNTQSQTLWRQLWTQFLPGTIGAAIVETGSLTVQSITGTN